MKITKLSRLQLEATSHGDISRLRKKVILKNGEVPHVTQFAQGYFEPGSVAPKHKHNDMYEIFFVEKGEVVFIVNDKEYILQSGDSITIEPNEYHEVRNKGNKTVVITYCCVLK